MASFISISTLLLLLSFSIHAQHLGMSFEISKRQRATTQHLESIYKTAVNVDSSLSVFKIQRELEDMYKAYTKLLQDLVKYRYEHDFKWDKPTDA